MTPIPVIAIFDVGKTNKKLFLFDEDYNIVFERSARFNETTDEDGFPCEKLGNLKTSIFESLAEIKKLKGFELKAVNFSSYGASLVYIDQHGQPLAPLYNYLKPYPEELKKRFFDTYGNESLLSSQTASPCMDSLNSGLQLFRIKHEKPELFTQIKYALHLPQYLSYLVTGQKFSDITSIGCHTMLWDFESNAYHRWVIDEGLTEVLAPLLPANETLCANIANESYKVGIGLHDSSAALIPYLKSFDEPFILISTGTWSISLNPFNQNPLTENELRHDCLNYLQYLGAPVKASRLLSGIEYDEQLKRIAAHFNQDTVKYRNLDYDPEMMQELKPDLTVISSFSDVKLSEFKDDIAAYYALVSYLVARQKTSTGYVLKDTPVKRMFVDGGFSKNAIFMHLLARAFPQLQVYAASMAQATAMGTALAIHQHWNSKAISPDLIQLNRYAASKQPV